jgi:hypothetical protein
MRISDATHRCGAVRPEAASSAVRSAEAPAFWLPVTSIALIVSDRFSASLTMPELSRSAKGSVVEATESEPTVVRSIPVSASRPASTAMVTLSSSQSPIARSPLASPRRPGAYHEFAAWIAARCRRLNGT